MTADEILKKDNDAKIEIVERDKRICERYAELREKYPFCAKTKIAEALGHEFGRTRQAIEAILREGDTNYEND